MLPIDAVAGRSYRSSTPHRVLVGSFSMPAGVLFALSAYALYSCCDAIIKGLGSGLSVYELAFFTTLFSLIPAMLLTPKGESWLTFWKPRHPVLLNLRGLSGMLGNLCIIYAFVTIPL